MDSILNWITYIPLIGALVILFFLREGRAIRTTATIVAIIDFFVSLVLWFKFDPKATGDAMFQFRFTSDWIPSLGVEYYILMLLLQTGMLGTFCALDFFLFYVFWEVMLVPMYFIIGIWGGPRKLYAAIKFFLFTLAGSVLMLLSILAL